MPGAEPWVRIERQGDSFKLPAGASLLQLWELLCGGTSTKKGADGESYTLVPSRWLTERPPPRR
jgi:hypothetical protein